MDQNQRIAQSETRLTKTVFPFNTNHHNTLFGGEALSWMDETAFIAATRCCRKTLVTLGAQDVQFIHAIAASSVVEIVAKVTDVGRTSLSVTVELFTEDLLSDGQTLAATGLFTFVAINEHKESIPVFND